MQEMLAMNFGSVLRVRCWEKQRDEEQDHEHRSHTSLHVEVVTTCHSLEIATIMGSHTVQLVFWVRTGNLRHYGLK